LNVLSFNLSDKFLTQSYLDPKKALDHIIASHQKPLLPSLLVDKLDEEADEVYYSVDFKSIKALSDDLEQEKRVSVVVVDYEMPLMDGLTFCKKLSGLPVLKIMLTGHADLKIAIDAFNQGIIDRFLVKDTPIDVIAESVACMQQRFFEKQSYPLLSYLSSNDLSPINTLGYQQHFKAILSQYSMSAYYLLDSNGSYLFISDQGKPWYWMVILPTQLAEYIDIAEDAGGSATLIQAMKNKTHAPMLITEEDYKRPITEWEGLLQPMTLLDGLYYAFFSF
jgi:CheY-like chemotaxis protein